MAKATPARTGARTNDSAQRRLPGIGGDAPPANDQRVERVLGSPGETWQDLLALTPLRRVHTDLQSVGQTGSGFARMLRALGVTYALAPEEVLRIPAFGPLLVVGNHPFDGIDGLIMADIVAQVRRDFRLLAGRLLYGLAELQSWLLPYHVFDGAAAETCNRTSLRLGERRLQLGGALGCFPGAVGSTSPSGRADINDPKWNAVVGQLARRFRASVVPFHFAGDPDQLARLPWRDGARPRSEWSRPAGETKVRHRVEVRIGPALAGSDVALYQDDEALTSHLRFNTYSLKPRTSTEAAWRRPDA